MGTSIIEDKPAYTVAEVAALMGFSRQKITAMFENESGVIITERPEQMRKRRHRSIRIPRAVYLRVLGRVVKAMRKKSPHGVSRAGTYSASVLSDRELKHKSQNRP